MCAGVTDSCMKKKGNDNEKKTEKDSIMFDDYGDAARLCSAGAGGK